MRFAWTVAGDDPDWPTMKRHGITGLFAPLFDDGLTTKAYLRDFQARGYIAGLYLGHNWFPGESAVDQARRVSYEYIRLTSAKLGSPAVKDVRVMLNWEQHDPEDIALGLEEWRRLHPGVGTSWSMEGMQGGWMGTKTSPEFPDPSPFIQRVLASRIRFVPQTFHGDMRGIAQDVVLRDLIQRGVPEHVVSLFYDAAKVGDLDRWDGYAFTAGRLP